MVGCLSQCMRLNISFAADKRPGDVVILVHGLGRTSKSFRKMARHLAQRGYEVCNIDYPSRKYNIQTLAEKCLRPVINTRLSDPERKVHFVTHSMGGIMVRWCLKKYSLENIGRIVMLAPPNQGSEVVDFLKARRFIRSIMGPAFRQLSTDPDGFVNTLGEVNADIGIIAGKRSIGGIHSILIPGPSDGKVSVARTRLNTMADFTVVRRAHTFIMNADEVIDAATRFIETGRFHATG